MEETSEYTHHSHDNKFITRANEHVCGFGCLIFVVSKY